MNPIDLEDTRDRLLPAFLPGIYGLDPLGLWIPPILEKGKFWSRSGPGKWKQIRFISAPIEIESLSDHPNVSSPNSRTHAQKSRLTDTPVPILRNYSATRSDVRLSASLDAFSSFQESRQRAIPNAADGTTKMFAGISDGNSEG